MIPSSLVKRLQKRLKAGNQATDQLRFRDAEKIYRECLEIAPQHPQILWNLGCLMQRRADNPAERLEAVNFYHDVIKCSNGDVKLAAKCFNNIGLIMGKINRIEEAEIAFGMALQMDPGLNAARINFADVLRHNGKYSEANREFGEVLKLDPDSAAAKFSRSMILLLFGELKEGFELYESRFDVDSFPTKKFKSEKPEWKGEDLTGKILLCVEEQGFGDALMFCRYFGQIKKRWPDCRIRFRGNVLYRNIAKGIQGLDDFSPVDEPATVLNFDYWIHILSLPHVFGTTKESIPSAAPYIVIRDDWSYIMSERVNIDRIDDKRIGICWAGSPRHGKDAFRSLAPEGFLRLICQHPTLNFYSLQVGPKAHECERLAGFVTDLAPTITDFTDTSMAIHQLDLVISVDTALVHLCGALDKPCWMLTPFSPDWRWLLHGETSPWYPRLRLFRQEKPGDWEPVLKRISEELGK